MNATDSQAAIDADKFDAWQARWGIEVVTRLIWDGNQPIRDEYDILDHWRGITVFEKKSYMPATMSAVFLAADRRDAERHDGICLAY